MAPYHVLLTLISLTCSHPILWVGGVTDSVAHFRAVGLKDGTLVVSTSPQLDNPLYNASVESDIASFEVTNLQPGTVYYYGVGSEQGTFHTFQNGPNSFKIGLGSCTSTPSNAASWIFLKNHAPDLFLMMGDLFYYNIVQNDTEVYSAAYRDVFDSKVVRDFFHSTAIAYIWDDHDYGPNNSDESAPGKESARIAYQDHVPHYPFPDNRSGDVAIYQAFTINNVRFILTDLRSEAKRGSSEIMSQQQEDWFFGELANFKSYSLVVWVSSRPWIGSIDEVDDWGGYPVARSRISNFISINNIDNLVMLAGDAHMVAIDDGSNSDYSTDPSVTSSGAGFPVFQAAPLDRTGSVKGGPFSHGCYTYTGTWTEQFGIMEISENSDNVTCIKWTGYRTDTFPTTNEMQLVTWSTCVPTVKKGKPGSGACDAEILPIRQWILIGVSYGIGVLLLLASLIMFRRMVIVEKRGMLRRGLMIVGFTLAYVATVVAVPIALIIRPLGAYRYRPAFMPADIGWVVVVVDVMFIVFIMAEFFFSKKNILSEDTFYLKLK